MSNASNRSAGFIGGRNGILMAIPLFYPHVGGAELQAERLAQRLRGRGFRVSFLTTRLPGTRRTETQDGFRIDRIWPDRGYLNACIHILDGFFAMLRMRKSVDVIHLHGASLMLIPACFMKWIAGKKVLVKIATGNIGGEIEAARTLRLGSVRLWFLRRASAAVAISREIEDELISAGVKDEKILRIPNGVDTEYFRPAEEDEKKDARRSLGIKDGMKVVLFAGRLTRQKGVDVLLRAWPGVSSEKKDVVLMIAGDGEERNNLEALARELQVSARFLGVVGDMRRCYWASDLFVFPSRYEGLPNAVLEAMACGLPIVATRTGGILEALEHSQVSRLVNTEDVAELRAALKSLLAAENSSPKPSERSIVEERFNLDRVASDYVQVYKNLQNSQLRDANAGIRSTHLV
ncbi:MAG: glycosyltransferase family 4 protein [Candidatus Eisenbacteria bacterium]|nr:glycosyltransferase family 4 protein [Candidatus Eisenbacteria bacterium]